MKHSKCCMWRGAVCIVVTACLLFNACTARGSAGDDSQDDSTAPRLTVEAVDVIYTPEEQETVTLELKTILSRAALLRDGLVLSEVELTEIEIYIKENILPMLCRARVGYADAVLLCKVAVSYLQEGESLSEINMARDFYNACMSVLGSRRGGVVLFESAALYALEMRDRALERYDMYGYAWYLADAEQYTAHYTALTEKIGETHFSAVLGACFFASSLIRGTLWAETDEGLTLTDAEICLLWQRQAAHLKEELPPAEVCSVTLEILFDWFCRDASVPEDLSDPEIAYYSALRECPDHAIRAGECLPLFVGLYEKAVSFLTPADVSLLRCGSSDEREQVICRILTGAPNEFLAVTDALSRRPFAREQEKDALVRAGVWESYVVYESERRPVSPELLWGCIEDYAANPDAGRRDALAGAWENYAFSVAPYATFIWWLQQGTDKNER